MVLEDDVHNYTIISTDTCTSPQKFRSINYLAYVNYSNSKINMDYSSFITVKAIKIKGGLHVDKMAYSKLLSKRL